MNRKLKISLYLAAIFAAGFGTGMFVSFQVMRHTMPNKETMAAHWCGDLQSKLALSPEQVSKIRPIIDDTLDDFKNCMSQGMFSTLSNGNARIMVQLTPAQHAKFEDIMKEQREMIRSRFGGGAPDPQKKPEK